jgi:hypothetical protein
MLRNIPQLYHLIPPVSITDTAVTRFAPLQSDPERFGIGKPNVHDSCYNMLFSSDFLARTGFSYDSYAYYFERSFEYSEDLEILYRQLRQQVDYWKALHLERFVELSFDVVDDQVSILDSRYPEECRYCLSREGSKVYLECDTRPTKLHRIKSKLESVGCGLSEPAFADAIDELVARRLIWFEDDSILGLAVPRSVSAKYRENGWCRTWDASLSY